MKTPPWVPIALAEKRVSEIPGAQANKRIVEYHAATTLKATSDEVPWCSAFACWCVEKAGVKSPKSARARDWLKWGVSVETPFFGCLVIVPRGDNPEQGHVGFWVAEDSTHVYIYGGNQGNSVCIEAFPKPKYTPLDYRMNEGWQNAPNH